MDYLKCVMCNGMDKECVSYNGFSLCDYLSVIRKDVKEYLVGNPDNMKIGKVRDVMDNLDIVSIIEQHYKTREDL